MICQIYPTKLQLNKSNYAVTEALFLNLDLSITNDNVSSKIYDKQDDFSFEIVNIPSLMEMFLAPLLMVCICIYFATYLFWESLF